MNREGKSNPFGRIQTQPMRPLMVAIDRFGKQIEAGHLVMFHMEEDPIFEVVSVGPALNPSLPGGQAIQVMLQAKFPVMFQPAAANRTMVICGESKARQEAMAARNGDGGRTHEHAPERRSEGGIILTDGGDKSGPEPVDEPTQAEQDAFDRTLPSADPIDENRPGDGGEKCDGEHDGTPCADPNCWRRPIEL